MIKAPLIFGILLGFAWSATDAPAQKVGDWVVTTKSTDVKVGGDVVGRVAAGERLMVKAVHGEWVGLAFEPAGWIPRTAVVPADQAFEQFTARIEQDPSDASARFARAKLWALRSTRDQRRAVDDFNEVLHRKVASADAYVDRAKAYAELGQYKKAVEDLTKALQLNPRHAEAYAERGRWWQMLGEHENALEDFDWVVRLRRWDAAPYLARSAALMKMGRHEDALVDGEKAIQLAPRSAEAYLRTGSALEKLGRRHKALQLYSIAIDVVPNNAELHFRRGRQRLLDDELEHAIEDLEFTLRIDPQHLGAHRELAKLRFKAGEYDRALTHIDTLLAADPSETRLLNRRGLIRWQRGELDEAIADFIQAIRLDRSAVEKFHPQHAQAFSERSQRRVREGDLDGGIDDLRIAIRLDAEKADRLSRSRAVLLTVRANQHITAEKFAEARADLGESLQDDPRYAGAFFARAYLSYNEGKYRDAVEDYDLAIRYDPTMIPAYVNLAWLLSTCPEPAYRDGKRALELALFASQLTRWEQYPILDTLAAAYAESGAFDEAVKWQTRVVASAPAKEKKVFLARLELYRDGKPFREARKETKKPVLVAKTPKPAAKPKTDPVAATSVKSKPAVDVNVPPDDPAVVAQLEKLGARLGRDLHDRVRSIGLQYTKFTNFDAAKLKALPLIEVLNLTFTQITDEGLNELAALERLKVLVLDETKITNAGLKNLLKCKNLELLSIKATAIDDAGLEHLKQLKQIKFIMLNNTNISSEAFEQLKKTHEKARIIR